MVSLTVRYNLAKLTSTSEGGMLSLLGLESMGRPKVIDGSNTIVVGFKCSLESGKIDHFYTGSEKGQGASGDMIVDAQFILQKGKLIQTSFKKFPKIFKVNSPKGISTNGQAVLQETVKIYNELKS